MNNFVIGKRLALSNWLRQFVTIIDPDNNRYKIQEGLVGIFKWGKFKPLPKINYVLIFRSFFAKCETCSIDEFENNANSYFQVSLVYNKNRRIIFHETKNKTEAFEIAKNISLKLNTQIKDSVTNAKKSAWLQ